MTDVVDYAPPLGWLGKLAHGAALHELLARIFDYRYAQIQRIFGAD